MANDTFSKISVFILKGEEAGRRKERKREERRGRKRRENESMNEYILSCGSFPKYPQELGPVLAKARKPKQVYHLSGKGPAT